jgi:hypothetical protein
MRVAQRQIRNGLVSAAVVLIPTIAASQNPGGGTIPCVMNSCQLVIDWGPGKNSGNYGADERYGSGDDFETALRHALTLHALRLHGMEASFSITVRPQVDTRSLCDRLPGTGSRYTCVVASDVAVLFSSNDDSVKAPGDTRWFNRCGGDRSHATMTQFGAYVGEMVWYSLLGAKPKEKRPALRC